ncbi:hypothetical protein PHPALM_28297 [Phytophthora palmivora]|uniref:ATP-binding cassette (ABC) Superfamily n=1 Tax=Phytophthora palmivora TaxID=4796 RepID=A0A2P4XAF8_9STRA|nr:hypothetical protein PHPALM_28297 [Phytophthora palmivora]
MTSKNAIKLLNKKPKVITTHSPAEDIFWKWVTLKNFAVQELKELRGDRLLSYVCDLRIEFAHLIAKRQLHSVMEGLRQQSKFSAHDERGYVNPEAAPTRFCDEGPPQLHKQLAHSEDSLHMEVELSVPIKKGRRSPRTLLSTRLLLSLILLDPQLQVEILWGHYCKTKSVGFEIALELGPGGQAAEQACKPGDLETLRQDMDALGRETRKTHGRVDRRVSAFALKELRRGLDALNHEAPTPAAPVVQRPQPRFEEWIVVPLKTPDVERWVGRHCLWKVSGACNIMSGQDRKGSNKAKD